ncbi:hypothetical protein VNO78_34340 [Psophocarpus tetragonolobus]|uniref:Uncharacterized protein n=1 Tax=Psophocarpus tetragonolobus TaxID=3891 RepID=A0AAN9RPY9_PSOTE
MGEVLERCEVVPGAGAAAQDVPLTFYDLHWAGPGRVKRIFLYQFPYSTSHFRETILPKLKQSLSLTLEKFFPLAGNLHCPPSPDKPFIRFVPNLDSVTLTLALDTPSSHFKDLVGNQVQNIQDLDHLVADLPLFPKPSHDDDDTLKFPMLSVKITLFPGEGICIATTYRHVIDGKSFSHFISYWASLCLNLDGPHLPSLPLLDRQVVTDPKGVQPLLLERYFSKLAFWKRILSGPPLGVVAAQDENIVRLTLELEAVDLKRLKNFLSHTCKPPPTNLSRLTATCALLWVSLVRSTRGSLEQNQDQQEWIMLQADCRNRIQSIPSSYFGSCLIPVGAVLKHKDFLGQDTLVAAIKVIDAALSKWKTDPLQDAEKVMQLMTDLSITGRGLRLTTVAGSPNFPSYHTDFGFGNPTKVDLVNMVNNFFFAESAKEEGAFQVGLSLNKDHLHPFLSAFQQALQTLPHLPSSTLPF